MNDVTALVSKENTEFPLEGGNRYHLYVSQDCRWCNWVVCTLRLLGLYDRGVINVILVDPVLVDLGEGKKGFGFSEAHPDPIFGKKSLLEVYKECRPEYTAGATVPLLVDSKNKKLVCNDSLLLLEAICLHFAAEFSPEPSAGVKLFPLESKGEITNWKVFNTKVGYIIPKLSLNDEKTIVTMYEALGALEEIFSKQPYLLGDTMTVVDVQLTVNIVRLDPVVFIKYNGEKCVADYKNVMNYAKRNFSIEHIRCVLPFEGIHDHYITHAGKKPEKCPVYDW